MNPFVLPTPVRPPAANCFQCHTVPEEKLVNVGGQERTTEQYADLLTRGGLRLTRTLPLGPTDEAMGHHLIEAQIA